MMPGAQNDLLPQLLALQQDGSRAISAPSNWRERPLLEVETDLDRIVEDLATNVLLGSGNEAARWHFFIGSPGNGKSAAVGKLYRQLLDMGCSAVDADSGQQVDSFEKGHIPYLVEIREAERQFSTVWLAQDASVVKDPYAPDVNPAADLLELLENATQRGVSLVVSTNRGVIEKAFRHAHTNPEMNRTVWFKAMRAALEERRGDDLALDFPASDTRQPFRRLMFRYTELDGSSLLVGRNTFERLLERACNEQGWETCDGCEQNSLCPFFANRQDLLDSEHRARFVRLLERAEILSGQPLVFREAVAMISFVLAGCPRDYEGTPCDWVRENVNEGHIFPLSARRTHMCLFSSYAPLGLETDPRLMEKQRYFLGRLADQLPASTSDEARRALGQITGHWDGLLSTDVGLGRMLGPQGIMVDLDIFSVPVPKAFAEKWDCEQDLEAAAGSALLSHLDLATSRIWRDLAEALQTLTDDTVEMNFWLQRWASAYTFRLGALVDGQSALATELDALLQVLRIQDDHEIGADEIETLRRAQRDVQELLALDTEEGIRVSDFVTLAGSWATDHLRPKIASKSQANANALVLDLK